VGGTHLITKVYFPRLILPLANTIGSLVEFCVSLLVMCGLMVCYRAAPGPAPALLCLPLFVLLAMLTSLTVGLWLSALMVRYRDVRHLLPFLTQLWMFLTPVAYSASIVPERWRWLYALNPMTGVVDGFRWGLLGKVAPHWAGVGLSAAIALLLFVGGLYYFRRTERTVVDII
jgi:lipopolysaccharide transport system permease protein